MIDGQSRRRPTTPVVLFGQDRLFGAHQSTISLARTYASTVLSFEELISEQLEHTAIRQFDAALLPGLRGRVPQLWVRHVDHDRTELHGLIARVVLPSGHAIEPYYHPRDLKRMDTFKRAFNEAHGLSSPDDPARARLSSPARPGMDSPDRQRFVAWCEAEVLNGRARSRPELIARLVEEGISAETFLHYIRISGPGLETPLRLDGGIFERDWRPGVGDREAREAAIAKYIESRQERLILLQESLQSRVRRHHEWLRKRYPEVPRIGPNIDFTRCDESNFPLAMKWGRQIRARAKQPRPIQLIQMPTPPVKPHPVEHEGFHP